MKNLKNMLLGIYVNLFAIIVLLVSLVLGLIKNNIESWMQWIIVAIVVISSISNMIFALKNIMNTYRLYKLDEYNTLRKYMKVMKFGTIPYFILNFILYVLLFLLFFAASRGLIVFTPIPLIFVIPIFFTYITVIFTSTYGIGFTAILSKEKVIKKSEFVLHVLLQLCFILDVISTTILLIKHKVQK